MNDDEEEDVLYLEHGLNLDSVVEGRVQRRSLYAKLSVTERDCYANPLVRKHHEEEEEAPKFRRIAGHRNRRTNAQIKRRKYSNDSQQLLDGSQNDGDDNEDAMEGDSCKLDFTHYTPNWYLRNGSNRHDVDPEKSFDVRNKHKVHYGKKRICDLSRSVQEEEELDRPAHWNRSGKKSKRRSPSRKSCSTTVVAVSKPLSISIADKMQYQKRNDHNNASSHNIRPLNVSFKPSWLPQLHASSEAEHAMNHNNRIGEVEDIITQNNGSCSDGGHDNDDRINECTSYNEFSKSHHNFQILNEQSYNDSAAPQYLSDSETNETGKPRKRRNVKKPNDRDILPKLLKVKRLQSELEIRFQTFLGKWRFQEEKDISNEHSKSRPRREGDLLDPRTRMKKFIDVTVCQHPHDSEGGILVKKNPPFIILALRVEQVVEKVISVAKSDSMAKCPTCKIKVPVVGEIVLGYFQPENLSKMGISVTIGKQLRIYNYVLISESDWISSSANVDTSARNNVTKRPQILLDTNLCESMN